MCASVNKQLNVDMKFFYYTGGVFNIESQVSVVVIAKIKFSDYWCFLKFED